MSLRGEWPCSNSPSSHTGTGAYLIAGSAGIKVRALPHYPLCISTKIVITALIAFKLLQQRRTMQRMFQAENRKELIKPYTSLIRILITSYALSSVVSGLFLGLYVPNLGAWRIVFPSTIQAGVWCSVFYLSSWAHFLFLAHITSTCPLSGGTKPFSRQTIRRRIFALLFYRIDGQLTTSFTIKLREKKEHRFSIQRYFTKPNLIVSILRAVSLQPFSRPELHSKFDKRHFGNSARYIEQFWKEIYD